MEALNINQLINDFYIDQIEKQLGQKEALFLAIESARIHLNKLIVIVSNLGRKDLAFSYHQILLDLNKKQFA